MTNEQVMGIVRKAVGRALGKYTNEGRSVPSVLPIDDTRKDIMHYLVLRQDELSALGVTALGDLGDVIELVMRDSKYSRKELNRPQPYWDDVSKCTIGPFKGVYWVKEK